MRPMFLYALKTDALGRIVAESILGLGIGFIYVSSGSELVLQVSRLVSEKITHIRSYRRQALGAIAAGHATIALVMVLNGTIGARTHVGFPVLNRSSFGFWFSYFSVISRVVLAMFWFGIQTYTGSECMYQVRNVLLVRNADSELDTRPDAQGYLAHHTAPSQSSA